MSWKRIGLLTVVFTLSIMYARSYMASQPRVATYTIKERPNIFEWAYQKVFPPKEDKRHNAIIKITLEVKKGQIGSNCTAFVINDTTAVTAAHCLGLTDEKVKFEFPKILQRSLAKEQQLLSTIIRLEGKCGGDPRCLALLKQAEIMLDRELAARKKGTALKASTYKVHNTEGLNTGIVAKAYSKHPRRDYGFLHGDFKNFKKMYVRAGWHVRVDDTLRACGFFGGKLPPTCVDFIALGNRNFYYAGESLLLPGVSGGPVIDHLGYVVGIASRVGVDHVLMEPILGILDITTEEQLKKIKEQNK